jgi:hypothetical protein
MNVPFALQLAHGNTRIGLTINIGLIAILVPSMIYMTAYHGALGGAAMWLVSNSLYLLVGIPVTHKYLLGAGVGDWAYRDVLPPLLASLAVVGLGRAVFPSHLGAPSMLVALMFILLLATSAAAASSSQMRRWGHDTLRAVLRP